MSLANECSPIVSPPRSIELLAPWALRPTIRAEVLRPVSIEQLRVCLGAEGEATRLPMGTRRSYGDACLNAGGVHLATEHMRDVHIDPRTGLCEVEAGVTLAEIAGGGLPLGWFPAVVPGTMLSSVAGALACDVHGKGHHGQGSFAASVLGIALLTGTGELVPCSREQNPELFWATVGGLGQTGVILRLTLQLRSVETAYIVGRQLRTRDLDETLRLCAEVEDQYSVCWIDSLAQGRAFGRGVLMVGHHASRQELPSSLTRKAALAPGRDRRFSLPFFPPAWVTGGPVWKTFNAGYWHGHRSSASTVTPVRPYFCPLDSVAHWNRVYGRSGFLEYQFAVPAVAAREVCREVLERLSQSGNGSFLAVLKRFGPGNAGYLSFPIQGYTLAVDMPARGAEQAALLDRLDGVVARAGGRVYLVKDSRMRAEWVDTMYPRRKEWVAVVNRFDPKGRFSSSLVRRLELRRE